MDHAGITERLPLALQRAERKIRSTVPAASAGKLLKAAQGARTVAQRVVWLQKAASAWAKPLEAVAACQKGCNHCCHIPVSITRAEAALIGRAARRTPAVPAHLVDLPNPDDADAIERGKAALRSVGIGLPCPFLVDGACAIYEDRPLACRTLLNLDDDDLLCRLVPGLEVEVPYANAQQLQGLYLAAQPGAQLADIREFFPSVQNVV